MAVHIPFSAKTYQDRRQILAENMGSGKILLIANAESSINFADNWHPYRQDSTLLYYGALSMPDIAIVIDADSGVTTLYADDLSIDMVVWMGPQPLMRDLAAQVGISVVKSYASLSKDLVGEKVHYLPPYRASQEKTLRQLLGVKTLAHSTALITAIISQRAIKTDEEIAELQKAVKLSKGMQAEVIKNIKPGMHEYELVAVASRYAHEHNARWSFPPIITKNGQTLHNHYHGHKIEKGDLVLVDGGIEIASGYCGDITRTTPATGTLTAEQKEIYDLVHLMYKESVPLSKAGNRNIDVHFHAASILVDGMKALGLMKGNTEDAVSAGAHALFFPHGLGHMMGLDVHDMENFGEQYVGYDKTLQKSTQFGLKSLRLGKTLETGNVITIEPGIYFIPELTDKWESEGLHSDFINYTEVAKKRNFGGIRIEDDFLVTDTGGQMLGGNDPMP